MNTRIKQPTKQANLSPPMERAEPVEGILQSLDAADPNLDRPCPEEANDRLSAWRRGEIRAPGFRESFARLDARS